VRWQVAISPFGVRAENKKPVVPSLIVSASPGGVGDRQGAVALRLHLGQAAGLETRRHQGKIAVCDNLPRHRFVEVEAEKHANIVAMPARGGAEDMLNLHRAKIGSR